MRTRWWSVLSATAWLFAMLPPVVAQVPVVFRVSEGVRPGAIVSLYGEYLTDTPSVRFLDSDGGTVATQTAVQSDPGGHFCRVVFPQIAPGAYKLSAQNAQGESTGDVFVNRAEPRWISEDRSYPGLALKLIGRKLDAREYYGEQNTQLRWVPTDGGPSTVIMPDEVNPYCVDLTVPFTLAVGEYYLEVRTGSAAYGGDWVRLDDHSNLPETVNDTVIRVESAPTDPTARTLQIAWANEFPWNRVVDAKTEFGAVGDGAADDTPAVQQALDHVAGQGGGVVYLANGIYKTGGLTLASKCILQGESRDGTVVMVSRDDQGAIVLQGESQGVSTMTIKYQSDVPPDRQAVVFAGRARHVFLYNIKFDLLRKPDVSSRQSPYYFDGDGPLLVANCQFYLSTRNQWDHNVRNRVTFRNNFIDMHDGLGFCMSSEKLLVLNNELVFHPAAYAGQMNGFFFNEGWMGWNIYNAYVANNVARELNGPGDCQPYCAGFRVVLLRRCGDWIEFPDRRCAERREC